MNYIYVGIGGFIGAILRVSTGNFFMQIFSNTIIPFSTLSINLLGTFILAFFLANKVKKVSSNFNLFFSTGLLGSFTTFSTFSIETINLLNIGEFWLALFYIMLSLLGGILFSWLGFITANIKLENIKIPSTPRGDEY